MIEVNSGKIFRFKLDFDLGFGFAEVYDFKDFNTCDGTKVFVFNRIDDEAQKSYKLSDIASNGIAMGPFSLYRYPNSRGIGAWKFLFKSDSYIIENPPTVKVCQDLLLQNYDWSISKRWYKSEDDQTSPRAYVPYDEVRALETKVMNSNMSVSKKMTMKYLIDHGCSIDKYYDMTELGNVNSFVQLVNTYYSLEQCRELIKIIPPLSEIGA